MPLLVEDTLLRYNGVSSIVLLSLRTIQRLSVIEECGAMVDLEDKEGEVSAPPWYRHVGSRDI